MRRMLRWALRIVVGAALLLVLACLLVLAWRGFRQHQIAERLRITTPDGVQEAGFVRIGGVDQWVQIRGEHRSNPILLFVHGGPGFAASPFTPVFRNWEKRFTLVQWDQRDAGRTYSRNGGQPLSIDQVTRDGLEVADHIRRRLGQPQVIVLGHSWGSAVALNMIHRRPDLFSAYVGTGQMDDRDDQEAASYAMVLARAKAARNATAVTELEKLGPPPYKGLAGLLVERRWLAVYDTPAERNLFKVMTPVVFYAPDQSLRELYDFNAAPKVAQPAAYGDVARFNARSLGLSFAVSMFVFEGDQDILTPPAPTQRWLDQLQAPRKALVLLKGGGHDAVFSMPDAFLAELDARVRPVAVR
jgi:pimeloyl-ACP methyl ester carboxylesterase